MEESLRAAAHIVADYERGTTPDDPFVFSACYQLVAAIRPRLPSSYTMLHIEQYVGVVADILAEMVTHDFKILSLIQTLTGTAPSVPPRAYHTPVVLEISPTYTTVNGNQYNLSGDFRGSIVNVASALDGVVQQVQAATLEASLQAELVQLLRMLRRVFEGVPATHAQDAEVVASAVARVIGLALKAEPGAAAPTAPDWTRAAAHLDGVLPEVSKLATGIMTQAQLIRQ